VLEKQGTEADTAGSTIQLVDTDPPSVCTHCSPTA